MNDDLRAAAQAATPLPHSNADQAIALVQAREDFRQLASPDRILALCDREDALTLENLTLRGALTELLYETLRVWTRDAPADAEQLPIAIAEAQAVLEGR